MVYYNEFDPFAAEWLRELIKAGLIADGEVDERSIEDVRPVDLRGFAQCHFFAGIGVWSRALRNAGVPDDYEVWTGSCPCQPFSAAGKRDGFADERHLWPAFYWLIRQCRPGTVFGEQVAGSHGYSWLDLVQADLEAESYTVRAVDICAAGFGAPHIRQRLYWCADSDDRNASEQDAQGSERRRTTEPRMGGRTVLPGADAQDSHRRSGVSVEETGVRAPRIGRRGLASGSNVVLPGAHADGEQEHAAAAGRLHADAGECSGAIQFSADSERERRCGRTPRGKDAEDVGQRSPPVRPGSDASSDGCTRGHEGSAREDAGSEQGRMLEFERASPSLCNGFWKDAEWLLCRDGKYRPVEPLLQPLPDGAADRMGIRRVPSLGNPEGAEVFFPLIHKGECRAHRLRGYGNAIVLPVAENFIRACMEAS